MENKTQTIWEKLLLIQNELKAPKNQYNSFGKYKYRSAEDIQEGAKPVCLKHKAVLISTDSTVEVAGLAMIETTVTLKCTETGSAIESKAQAGINPNRKGMDIAQCFGASSSYARKYAMSGLFLLDDTKDADAGKAPTSDEKATQRVRMTGAAGADGVKAGTSVAELQKKYIMTDVQVKKYEDMLAEAK